MSENRASRSDRLCAVQGVWKERMCECRRFGREACLVSDAPVRHPRIDRIADEVTPRGIVELGREVEIRIVDDRGFTAFPDLPEHLADDGRLSGSGVPDQEKVTGLVTEGDPGEWTHPPFAAELADGRIYGRGAADMKGGVAAMMIAAAAIKRSGAALADGATGVFARVPRSSRSMRPSTPSATSCDAP